MRTTSDRSNLLLGQAAELLGTWGELVVKEGTIEERILAANTLGQYIGNLIGLKHPVTGNALLPGDFGMYADCVTALLDGLLSLDAGDTIHVHTVLTKPPERWYNIGQEYKGHIRFAFTNTRWEKYKATIAGLTRKKRTLAISEHMQFRRIVAGVDRSTYGQHLLVYRGTVAPVSARLAKQYRPPACAKLLPEIENTINDPTSEYKLHLIARHEGDVDTCTGNHGDWFRLDLDFEDAYHDAVHCKDGGAGETEKGVYCCFSSKQYHSKGYEDVFLLELENNQGCFGIGYFNDKGTDRQGIVFLKDAQIHEQVDLLRRIWDSEGGQ